MVLSLISEMPVTRTSAIQIICEGSLKPGKLQNITAKIEDSKSETRENIRKTAHWMHSSRTHVVKTLKHIQRFKTAS